jgi:hypothetical protein
MIFSFITAVAWILVVLFALALVTNAVLNRITLYRFKMKSWVAFGGSLSIVWLLVKAFS